LEEAKAEREASLNMYQQRLQAALTTEHRRRKALFGA